MRNVQVLDYITNSAALVKEPRLALILPPALNRLPPSSSRCEPTGGPLAGHSTGMVGCDVHRLSMISPDQSSCAAGS